MNTPNGAELPWKNYWGKMIFKDGNYFGFLLLFFPPKRDIITRTVVVSANCLAKGQES
jgi:hypothetical protein